MLDRGLYCFRAGFSLVFHLKNMIKTHLIYENKQGAVYIRERVNMARVRYMSLNYLMTPMSESDLQFTAHDPHFYYYDGRNQCRNEATH